MNTTEPYLPLSPERDLAVMKFIKKAMQRNADMDASDRKRGNANPAETGISGCLRTAISAIVCGMGSAQRKGELHLFDEVAEGLVLVMQAELLARQLEEKLKIVVKTKKDGNGMA
jgi:hypothetical protein